MRLHLSLALITILALVVTLRAERRHHFTFDEVQAIAKKRSERAYAPLPDVLPPELKKLTPAQDAGIFPKETARLWRKKGLPFQVDFYHQLASNPQPHIAPAFNVVDAKGSHHLPYSSLLFNFQSIAADTSFPPGIGFAGFYLRFPDMGIGSKPNSLDGFFSALGASYFRALAREQVYGLSGRALAINPSLDDPKKPEEFPAFTDWWLHEPTSTATEVVLDALLDGPSVSGAYEFTIRPGVVTSIDVHALLYFRASIDRLGIAPFSSMYLFGENAPDHFKDNIHPEVHDSDGALIQDAKDEWMWRPLSQSNDARTGAKGNQLQLFSFAEENPKGFGLIQRDRDFQHYQDLDMKYNVRPSAWVMPHGDWGKGEVMLVERPSNDFNTDNIVFFWHPAQAIKAGDHLDLSYTIDFYMNDAQRPPLAFCKQTLINVPAPPPPNAPPSFAPVPKSNAPASASPPPAKTTATPAVPTKVTSAVRASDPFFVGPPAPNQKPIPVGTTPVQFLVDFAGAGIENTPANQAPDLDLTFDPPGTYLRDKIVEKNGYDNSWRVTFTIIPFKHNVATELKCRLLRDKKSITETWSYSWNQ